MNKALLAIFVLGGMPVAAQAQQTTLCTSMVTDNPSNPYTDGIVAVSETFPVEGSGDYSTAWKAHIDQKYPSKLQRTSQCSSPADDPATAAQGRLNFINKWEAGFQTDLEPWRPEQQRASSGDSGADASDSSKKGQDDANSETPSNGSRADAVGPNRPAADSSSVGESSGTGQRPICATQPFDSPNTAFPQGSAMKITNTCHEPLSVRICLRVEGKWDCGVNWGVPPGADWSWGSTRVYTGWFWDARLSSSNQRLASPED